MSLNQKPRYKYGCRDCGNEWESDDSDVCNCQACDSDDIDLIEKIEHENEEDELVEISLHEFNVQCSLCHRKGVDEENKRIGDVCGMIQPDGSKCQGKWIPL